jgi:putative ABC transport system permease protein
MLRNYLTTAYRFLIKNQLFTGINLTGLAVSIACCMIIYLYIKSELAYDEFHQDVERLYVLGEGSKDENNPEEAAYYQTVYPSLPTMMREFPEIETGTRYFDWEGHVLLAGDKKFMHQVYYVDSTFLETLPFALLSGDPATALHKKDQIVISESIAMKFFNTTDALGKIIELESGRQYIVSAVLGKIPANSSIRPEVLISLLEKDDEKEFSEMANWYNTIAQVVIKVKTNSDIGQLRAKLPAFVKKYYDASAKDRALKIYPLADLRQSTAQNKTFIYGLTCIGTFILLLAVINFMNLSVAASLKRLRETGMRKVMGSSRNSIVLQFFLEAFLLTLLAIAISLGLLQLTLPFLNDSLGMSLELTSATLIDVLFFSGLLAAVIGLIAGGYPALYLSSYNTANAVKGIVPNYQGKITLRNLLVVIQFVVSITMIIGVIVASRQIHFMKTADLKFNRENVLVVNMEAGFRDEKAARARLEKVLHDVGQNPDVSSVSFSQNVPGRYWENYNGFVPEDGTEVVGLRQATVDDSYLETYGIKILEGRNFSRDLSTDTLNKVMINEAARKALGWDTAAGKTLSPKGNERTYTVIGVFDDFHYRSLKGNVQPLIHYYIGPKGVSRASFISLKLMPAKAKTMLSYLQDEWKSLDAWLDFNYFFVDEEFDKQYLDVERTLLLITFFTGVAIVISCSGIFALTAIAAQQRTKEIGIRKVLGASVSNIVALLSLDFLKLVCIAIMVAIPFAWYGMKQWLQDFAYPISLQWWIFILAGFVAIVIAFFTIGLQSVKAALNNPVNSLHND